MVIKNRIEMEARRKGQTREDRGDKRENERENTKQEKDNEKEEKMGKMKILEDGEKKVICSRAFFDTLVSTNIGGWPTWLESMAVLSEAAAAGPVA